MLAAGTLTRKYNPTIAELLGKAHEYSTSPLAALRFMLGRGKMPSDYEQDIHNNALGIELGQKAKTQAELEKLVLEAAEQAANQRTLGRAWIGSVQDDTSKTKYAAGKAIEGRPAFMTDEELKAFQAEFAPKPEGMAQGGMVSSNHFDPIKIKQIIASLDDEYDPERIQQIIAHQESSYA